MGTERVLQAGKRLAAALEKYKFLLLVLLAGLLLLLLPSSGGTQGAEPAAQAEEAFLSLAELEEKLARTLSKIEGAGEVTVALTLRSGARQVLAQDVAESDRDGVRSQERTTVVLRPGGAGGLAAAGPPISGGGGGLPRRGGPGGTAAAGGGGGRPHGPGDGSDHNL